MQPSAAISARLRAVEARLSEGEARLSDTEAQLRRLLAKEEKGRKLAAAAGGGEVTDGEEPAGYTVEGICDSMGRGFGKSTLYVLWKEGRGPPFIRVKGRRIITREGRAAWIRQLEEEQRTRMAEAEAGSTADGHCNHHTTTGA